MRREECESEKGEKHEECGSEESGVSAEIH